MGHCSHSLPSSIYHSPHVEHSLLDFSWPQTTLPVLLYHWVWKASWSTAVLKNSILQSPLSLICQTNLWIESVSGMDGAWWMLSGSTISSNLGKCTVIIYGTNFMAASENYLGVWNTIWPDFTFQKMTFLMVPPTPSIGPLPWCLSSKNQHNDLFKNIVPANSCKINLDRKWAPIPSLHKMTLVNDLPHSVSMVSITFFRQLIDVILLWSEFSVTTTTLLLLISLVTPLK